MICKACGSLMQPSEADRIGMMAGAPITTPRQICAFCGTQWGQEMGWYQSSLMGDRPLNVGWFKDEDGLVKMAPELQQRVREMNCALANSSLADLP